MRKLLCFIITLSLLSIVESATAQSHYTRLVDSIYAPLSKTGVTTGILYDRSYPMAAVNSFNVAHPDTSSKTHFLQAYFELYNATYSALGWFVPDTLHNRVNQIRELGKVPVGLSSYSYNYIDTNAITNNLIYLGNDSLLYDVPNRPASPFQIATSVIASPLIDSIQTNFGNSVVFNFSNNLVINKSGLNINSLQVDFDNGGGLVSVSLNADQSVYYGPSSTGIKYLKFVIGLSNNTTVTTYGTIKVISWQNYTTFNTPNCTIGAQDFTVFGYAPFQGYTESSPSTNMGSGRVYFATNTCDGLIRKPIIVVDGFDPTNERGINAIYGTINKPVPGRPLSFAADLRSRGYDIIILDFPGRGADYIERNAQVLISAINWVNGHKQGNEKLVLVGPSMGGLISRYALAYMEQHSLAHQVRLFASFDAPHNGANIPLGDQHFLDYFAEIDDGAKVNRDAQLNSPAAKQMLVNHYLADSMYPAGAPGFRTSFVQAMNNIGWPAGDPGQPFRKIALVNGSLGGHEINSACQKAFTMETRNEIKLNLILFKVKFKTVTVATGRVYFTPSYGNICAVFEGTQLIAYDRTRYFQTPSGQSGIDVAPGGTFPTQKLIADQGNNVVSHVSKIRFYTQFYSVVPGHSFISTKSALAFTGQNQNLSENISNRSLICAGETPFNSYFGDLSQNREHIDLWNEAIDYLNKEIDGIPQAPPISNSQLNCSINGPNNFCSSTNYTINNLPSGSSVNWTVSGPATVSSSGTTGVVNVVGNEHGYVTITAEVVTPCGAVTVSKLTHAGSMPANDIWGFNNGGQVCGNTTYNAGISGGPYSYYNWTVSGGTLLTGQGTQEITYLVDTYNSGSTGFYLSCHVFDDCGRPIMESPIEYATIIDCGTGGGTVSSRVAYYPNPANTTLTVGLNEEPKSDELQDSFARDKGFKKAKAKNQDFQFILFDKFGKSWKNGISRSGEKIDIDVRNLPPDTYYLHIKSGQELVKKQVIIQHR